MSHHVFISPVNKRLANRRRLISSLYDDEINPEWQNDNFRYAKYGKDELIRFARSLGMVVEDPSEILDDEDLARLDQDFESIEGTVGFKGEVRFPIEVSMFGQSFQRQGKVVYNVIPHFEFFDPTLDRLVFTTTPGQMIHLHMLVQPDFAVTMIESTDETLLSDNAYWFGPLDLMKPRGLLPSEAWEEVSLAVFADIAKADTARRQAKGIELAPLDHYSPGFKPTLSKRYPGDFNASGS